LAEQFERIDVNTERLRLAKEHFDQGEIAEARKVLKSELELMRDEQAKLIERRREYTEEILPKLRNNSEEYLLLALLAVTDYQNGNRLNEALEYFKNSTESLETKENLIQYGTFYMLAGRMREAAGLYDRYWKKFVFDLNEKENIEININLGILYSQLNLYEEAENSLNRALELLKKDNAELLPDYKSNFAKAIFNLAGLYLNQSKFRQAREKYDEALPSIRELAAADNFQFAPLLAETQNNIGYLLTAEEDYAGAEKALNETLETLADFENKNKLSLPYLLILNDIYAGNLFLRQKRSEEADEHYQNALKVIDVCYADNPSLYLPYKAVALNSLGVLAQNNDDLEKAQNYLEAALSVITDFFVREPQTYCLKYCMCLANLAALYRARNINRDLSINFAASAIAILNPIVEGIAYAHEHYINARKVLEDWGLTQAEMEAEIEKVVDQIKAAANQP
jgi:tetratricopeptide (TPR) repeat protein